jgi:hypothetical protein
MVFVYVAMRIQKLRTKKWVSEVLKRESVSINDLPASARKKILLYYGVAVPALAGSFFAFIRGNKISENEKRTLTLSGAATGLFDDMFDEEKHSDAYIRKILETPEIVIPEDMETRAFKALYIHGLSTCANTTLVKNNCLEIYKIQIESRKQKDGHMSVENLAELTRRKGVLSLRLYASLLDATLPASMIHVVEEVGSVGQLENDIFDVWRDLRDGIQTLATLPDQLESLHTAYRHRVDTALAAFKYAGLESNIAQKFFCLMAARGFVCLDKYRQLAHANQGKFRPGLYTRQQLLCDMQTPWAQLRLMRHYVWLSAQ